MNEILKQSLGSETFVALDLETTGVETKKSEILEIAAIRFTADKEIARFHSLTKPVRGLNYEAMKVNGITEEQLNHAPSLDSVLPEFLNFISDSILIIQNAEFDLSFLLYEARIRQISFPTLPVLCTVQLTRKLFPKIRHNLSSLRVEFGILHEKNRSNVQSKIHEAMDDSYAAMEVFKKCVLYSGGWKKSYLDIYHHEKGYKFTSDFEEETLFT
ncbi:MAG: 3'-5' exonuclease [Leptospiraceae bacterium]|nr:3'-5' exonuclease [Leptospiraceae bacterium]